MFEKWIIYTHCHHNFLYFTIQFFQLNFSYFFYSQQLICSGIFFGKTSYKLKIDFVFFKHSSIEESSRPITDHFHTIYVCRQKIGVAKRYAYTLIVFFVRKYHNKLLWLNDVLVFYMFFEEKPEISFSFSRELCRPFHNNNLSNNDIVLINDVFMIFFL